MDPQTNAADQSPPPRDLSVTTTVSLKQKPWKVTLLLVNVAHLRRVSIVKVEMRRTRGERQASSLVLEIITLNYFLFVKT